MSVDINYSDSIQKSSDGKQRDGQAMGDAGSANAFQKVTTTCEKSFIVLERGNHKEILENVSDLLSRFPSQNQTAERAEVLDDAFSLGLRLQPVQIKLKCPTNRITIVVTPTTAHEQSVCVRTYHVVVQFVVALRF